MRDSIHPDQFFGIGMRFAGRRALFLCREGAISTGRLARALELMELLTALPHCSRRYIPMGTPGPSL